MMISCRLSGTLSSAEAERYSEAFTGSRCRQKARGTEASAVRGILHRRRRRTAEALVPAVPYVEHSKANGLICDARHGQRPSHGTVRSPVRCVDTCAFSAPRPDDTRPTMPRGHLSGVPSGGGAPALMTSTAVGGGPAKPSNHERQPPAVPWA